MTTSAEYRAAERARLAKLRPTNPRSPVAVHFAQGRATATLPPGSQWAEDPTGKLLWVKLESGLLRLFEAAPDGTAREVTVPGEVEVEAYKTYFPN